MRAPWFTAGCVLAAFAVVLFLGLPLVALLVDQPPRALLAALDDGEALDALRVSALCTAAAIALVVAVGTPAAYLLATRRFAGRAVVLTVVELPLVVPPAVAGVALLAAFGPRGLVGGPLEDAGVRLALETAGVVCALAFVAAPFYVRTAIAAFAAVPREPLEAARTLGAGEARVLARVAVPEAAGGLSAGVALAAARALGEFGATLVFAGSLRGVTQTAPLAIYERLGTDLPQAVALSCVLLAAAGALLLAARLVAARRAPHLGASAP